MIQFFMYVLLLVLCGDIKTDALGDIKKGFKKAGSGLKKGTEQTGKALESANKATAQGLTTAAQKTKTGVQTATQETEKYGKIGAEKTEDVLVELGKSQYEPFIKPGKELKEFKSEKYYGVGGGKTVEKGDTATWHIGTGCLIGVKAWKIQKLQTTAGEYITMSPDQKANTDIDIVVDEMQKKKKLTINDTINYNKFLDPWTVYEVTAGDNQCIHHNFSVKEKNGKISIDKTK